MSNNVLEGIIKDKDYNFKKRMFKISKDYNLNINELLLLIYFINQDEPSLDILRIKEITYLEEKEILEAFTLLNSKGLIVINMSKQSDGKVSELIDISNVYKAMISDINKSAKKQTKNDIYQIFEEEFGRTLSPIEFELISAWIKSGIEEDLIIGALKEATYNGVRNMRYIDKIIYERGKKGFKTMNDVNNHIEKNRENRNNKKEEVLFDYNWLEDDE